MKYVEVVADSSSTESVLAIAQKAEAADVRSGEAGGDGMQQTRLLIGDDKLQAVLDDLQAALGSQPASRIVVLPVETSLPKAGEQERRQEDAATAARESLYEEVEKGVRLDVNFFVLVVLSTVVAAIGLLENNVAVVIGAMVIAPLLGPNLALSLGTSLGDVSLMRRSVFTLLAGVVLTVALAAGLAMLWPSEPMGAEIVLRTQISLDAVALALAAGAAAALSLTTGLSSILVGVMVAVALLPPAATMGLMVGFHDFGRAINAGLLLAINIVCVNLASKIVFLFKGVRPRTWLEKEKARRAMVVYVVVWVVTLGILVFFVYTRGSLTP